MTAVWIVLIIFSAITAWRWMELHAKGDSGKLKELEQRLAAAEAELAETRRLLDDAILEQDRAWSRLDSETGKLDA